MTAILAASWLAARRLVWLPVILRAVLVIIFFGAVLVVIVIVTLLTRLGDATGETASRSSERVPGSRRRPLIARLRSRRREPAGRDANDALRAGASSSDVPLAESVSLVAKGPSVFGRLTAGHDEAMRTKQIRGGYRRSGQLPREQLPREI